MDYRHYQLEDFLKDEFFVNWVLHPDQETDHFWKKWISTNPDRVPVVEQAQQIVQSISYKNQYQLTEEEYTGVFEQVLKANNRRNNKAFVWRQTHTFRLAAVIALLLAVTAILYLNQPEETLSVPEMVMIKAAPGQKRNIQLADGTKVMLNSGSSLVYPKEFVDSIRQVTLYGEAFFDVKRNPQQPFLIESGQLTTRVLGTSFNVRSYTEERQIYVAVVTGKVQIESTAGRKEVLLPEDMGVFNKDDGTLNQTEFDPELLIGWTEGLLAFENQTLPEIFKSLEKWYGVKIEVDESLNLEGQYSGRYQNKPLEVILKGISYTSHFNYSINHKTIRIYDEEK
ncbi:FecR family protein [Marinoscillum sp.]|uniref:FecR family protein n=1 Tax=Marinoscillum sp. TaxID=2024838 RepID=UPI003BA9B0D3